MRLTSICRPLILTAVICLPAAAAEDSVDFNRDIRPLISDRCLTCHGPDDATRQADLRLDLPDRLKGGELSVVVPGDPESSPLYQRIAASDPDLRMPPQDSGKSLSEDETQLIRDWIRQGATWDDHWAWVAPVRPEIPGGSDESSPVDAFIRDRLRNRGLSPSPEADRETLIRRLSFDLTGLPPEWDDVEAFVNDSSADAWPALVDRLLQSPHFGERMAVYWLDVVRYADSNGYHSDEPRQCSPYRDYVIDAFNSNKPYDEFIVEQLAGDLLPDATAEQHVASGFNMLLQTTSEGGAQPKEYIAKYAADRVRNTSQIFLGSTMGCAECHNHKFDPFTAADFYRFAAFFADIEQPAVGNPPTHPVITDADQAQLDAFDRQIQERKQELAAAESPELAAARNAWEQDIRQQLEAAPSFGAWRRIGPFPAADFDTAWSTQNVDPKSAELRAADSERTWQPAAKLEDGKVHSLDAVDFANIYLHRNVSVSRDLPVTLSLGSDDAIQVWLNGTLVHENRVQRGVEANQDRVTLELSSGSNDLLVRITNAQGQSGFYFQPVLADLPDAVAAAATIAPDQRTEANTQTLDTYFRSVEPLLQPQRDAVARVEAERKAFFDQLPRTLMTRTSQPKTVRLLNRGNWMDESGPVMEPAIPAFLGSLETDGERLNRLDLARWIASPSNPLTARVMVNRLWKLCFGKGLATPLDDFGRQGVLPTHPQLLDWLACEFVDSGYDVKHILRLLVTSETYRQSARPTPELRKQDPANQLYARQSRFRLDAEFVRDNALAVSGLLVRDIGGRSVFPYQPAGYWTHMNFPKREWPGDSGDALYRRGVYTWWQRMFLHPSLKAFDAPSREECTVARPRSNIPQQALVLLNDPTYVEAAKAFAARIIADAPAADDESRIRTAWQIALGRNPRPAEIAVLQSVLSTERDRRAESGPSRSSELPGNEDATGDDAWIAVARTILNLSETITRP